MSRVGACVIVLRTCVSTGAVTFLPPFFPISLAVGVNLFGVLFLDSCSRTSALHVPFESIGSAERLVTGRTDVAALTCMNVPVAFAVVCTTECCTAKVACKSARGGLQVGLVRGVIRCRVLSTCKRLRIHRINGAGVVVAGRVAVRGRRGTMRG